MRRVVSVFLPNWATDRIQRRLRQAGPRRDRPAERLILLTAVERGRTLIAARCPSSEARGVTVGMTLAHARALLPGKAVHEAEHDPDAGLAALRALACWALRFTPLACIDPPDGLLLDITGCPHLHGGEDAMLRNMSHALRRLGFAVRLASADTIGCAWAAARHGASSVVIIPSGQERTTLARLPIRSLRLDADALEALGEVGVERVGDLLLIRRAELVARFGMGVLTRLDQALGLAAEPLTPIKPVTPIVAEREFDGAVIDQQALMITVRELLGRLLEELAKQESGVTRLETAFHRLDAAMIPLSLRLSRASRDERHLWSLLKPRVEAVNMGCGVERITLEAALVQRLPHQQQCEWEQRERTADQTTRAEAELIDALVHRLGPERTLRPHKVSSHRPERAAGRKPATSSHSPAQAFMSDEHRLARFLDHPSALLDRPELIDVMAMTPEGFPIWLRWRGEEQRLISAIGPERLSPEWWLAQHEVEHETRDYFKVQDQTGRWLWIYRSTRSHQWHVHGQWM